MPTANKNIDWDELKFTIHHEDCVLFIGPEVAKNKSYFNRALYDLMSQEYKEKTYFLPRDELFVVDEKDRVRLLMTLDKLNDESYDEALYTKLAYIPFHLIISSSPDLNLKKTFEKENLEHEFHYYTSSRVPGEISEPTSEKPVLFNLIGSVEDRNSLVLTYKDLYKYIKAIMGDKPLPNNLLNELKNVTRFLFLGFKFEKWYVQLLMAMLYEEISKEKNEGMAPSIDISPEADEICTRQFNISFIDSDIEEFVEKLYTICEQEGILRKPSETVKNGKDTTSGKAYLLIKEDRTEEALDLLGDFFSDVDQEYFQSITNLSFRYNRQKRRLGQKRIRKEDADLEFNDINQELLELIEEVKYYEEQQGG